MTTHSRTRETICVLSGAGISAPSGIPTFRASDGLWENHRIEDVATPDAWRRQPQLVLDFYNQRRTRACAALPNEGHKALARLQARFDVHIITQNVDDLHERAGSTSVLHLHGELTKARSTKDPSLTCHIGSAPIRIGDQCELGSQLRPHIVWFGEDVPLIPRAAQLAQSADRLLVVGTSLVVYPAASLVHFATRASHRVLIDLDPACSNRDFEIRHGSADTLLPQLAEEWLSQ